MLLGTKIGVLYYQEYVKSGCAKAGFNRSWFSDHVCPDVTPIPPPNSEYNEKYVQKEFDEPAKTKLHSNKSVFY